MNCNLHANNKARTQTAAIRFHKISTNQWSIYCSTFSQVRTIWFMPKNVPIFIVSAYIYTIVHYGDNSYYDYLWITHEVHNYYKWKTLVLMLFDARKIKQTPIGLIKPNTVP
jgi:hypothetical protein